MFLGTGHLESVCVHVASIVVKNLINSDAHPTVTGVLTAFSLLYLFYN